MRNLHRIVSMLLLTVLCLGLLALPAAATTTFMEYEGLEVTVEMDKEHYDVGEAITATITVKNTGNEILVIANLEQLIPDGYRLSGESQASARNIELLPGRTAVLEVTFEGESNRVQTGTASEAGGFLDTLLYGETWGVPNILLAVLALIGIVVFFLLT